MFLLKTASDFLGHIVKNFAPLCPFLFTSHYFQGSKLNSTFRKIRKSPKFENLNPRGSKTLFNLVFLLVNKSICNSVCGLVSWSVSQLVGQSVDWSDSWSASWSIGWLVG